jgi:hypothetical protein
LNASFAVTAVLRQGHPAGGDTDTGHKQKKYPKHG